MRNHQPWEKPGEAHFKQLKQEVQGPQDSEEGRGAAV